MKKGVAVLFFLLSIIHLSAQSSSNKTLIDKNVLVASIDPLGQIVYINQSKQVVKISNIQDQPYIYSDLTVGINSQLVTDNVFKTILYKKDIGDFLLFDNRLKLLSKSNFFDLGYFSVDALAVSNDQKHIWIFDSERQQLIKLNQQYGIAYQSNNFTQYLSQSLQAVQMSENKQYIYLLDQKEGLYIFDNSAVFVKKYPIADAEKFWLINDQIYFYRGKTVWKYNQLLFEETPVIQLNEDYTSIDINRDFMIAIDIHSDLYRFDLK